MICAHIWKSTGWSEPHGLYMYSCLFFLKHFPYEKRSHVKPPSRMCSFVFILQCVAIRICICALDVLVYSSPLCLRAAERVDERRRRNNSSRWWSRCRRRRGGRLHLPCVLVINPLAILSKQSQFAFIGPTGDVYPPQKQTGVAMLSAW